MRMIITGIQDGRSCVIEEINCDSDPHELMSKPVYELALDAIPPRPQGKGDYVEIPVAPRSMQWMRVSFLPDQSWGMHQTDTIDCHTIVSGSIDLILDDGTHRLLPGDSAVVSGVDHAWQAGPDGCATSILIFATDPPPG